ncbi:MAG: phage tail tape measure protein [Rubrivivax sp.]
MTDPLKLSLDLSLNDRLVGPLRRALADVRSELRSVGADLGGVGRGGQEAARGLENVGRQARGVRDAAAGVRDLDRATKDAERSASRLAQTYGTVRGLVRGIGGVMAGGAAFAAVTAAPVRRAADYDTALRGLANTAYAGQPLAARRAGLGGLDAAITSAVRVGGGTRDQALATLNELVASGVFSNADEAMRMLPTLQRGGTASGADPVELARIAIRARQTFNIPSAQTGNVLGMAMAAGQAGGFELRDMARWLPQQMAAARSLGLSGTGGLAQLLAANQASVITAGSRDEAGNNLVNLLAKINSSDTARDFKHIGIDLPGSLAAARGKGVDGLTAFVNMVDKLVAGDARFQAARRGATSASSDERRAAYAAQADILQGSSVGQVIQDRQALMALIALMNNRSYTSDVLKSTQAGGEKTIADAFALFQEGAGFKFDQRSFEVQRAQTEAMNSSNSVIAKLAEAQTDLYQRYPGFAAALEGAKVAVSALAASAAAASAVLLLTRAGGGASLLSSLAGGAGAGLAAAGGAGALAAGAGGLVLAGGAGYAAGSLLYKGIEGTSAADGIGEVMAKVLAFFGNEEAQRSLDANRQAEAALALQNAANALANRPPIKLMIDGREITSVVDDQVEWYGRRQ